MNILWSSGGSPILQIKLLLKFPLSSQVFLSEGTRIHRKEWRAIHIFPCSWDTTNPYTQEKTAEISSLINRQLHSATTIPNFENPEFFHHCSLYKHAHTVSLTFLTYPGCKFSHYCLFSFLRLLFTTWSLLSGECPAGKNKLPLQVHPGFNLLLSQ